MTIGNDTYDNIAYGPIHSRRLGTSLGINLMPNEQKLCSFNCVYCECGWNPERTIGAKLPTVDQVCEAMEYKLKQMKAEGQTLDVITFSGNGEPTLHPQFLIIVRATRALRDQYFPNAKVTVLSNSTQLGREEVVEALRLCDNRILKLDAGTDEQMHAIDKPVHNELSVERICQWLRTFQGDFTLQTCFVRSHNGEIDNTTPEQLEAWYRIIADLHPKQVMMYVIDRKTPMEGLERISRERMEEIAQPVRDMGIDVVVTA